MEPLDEELEKAYSVNYLSIYSDSADKELEEYEIDRMYEAKIFYASRIDETRIGFTYREWINKLKMKIPETVFNERWSPESIDLRELTEEEEEKLRDSDTFPYMVREITTTHEGSTIISSRYYEVFAFPEFDRHSWDVNVLLRFIREDFPNDQITEQP